MWSFVLEGALLSCYNLCRDDTHIQEEQLCVLTREHTVDRHL